MKIKLTSPVLAMIFVVRNYVPAGHHFGDVDHSIERCVDQQTGNKAVGRAVLTLVYKVSVCLTCGSYMEVTYSRRV